ncbi:MAG: P-loop NTPase [Thermoanaerobaculia bacterium]
MRKEEVEDAIAKNLARAALEPVDVVVSPDPFGGWNVLVVSEGFQGRSLQARRDLVLNNIDQQDLEWVELLTSDERKWAGATPADYDLQQLPLWPEALAQPSSADPQSGLLDADDADVDLPVRVTFYSVRGGVGRSTALAYAARILADRGKKVVVVDMDLEAPGLPALLGVDQHVASAMGVVYLLDALDRGEKVDVKRHLIRVSEQVDLYCLPAGIPSANYTRLLRHVAADSWYRSGQNPLRKLYAAISEELPFKPDVILTDARTGFNNANAPLLFDLADMVIIVFFPHPQARVGNAQVVQALTRSTTYRSIKTGRRFHPELRFVVSPIPSARIGDVTRHYKNRAAEWIGEWLNLGKPGDAASVEEDLVHFISYTDAVAASDSASTSSEQWRPYNEISEWIESLGPAKLNSVSKPVTASSRIAVLHDLHFSSGTAEQQADLLSNFVETDVFKKALSPSIPLILGRKGTGKTALFRRLSEESTRSSVVITAPAPLRKNRPWLLSAEGFRSIDEQALQPTTASWRQFWSLFLALALRSADATLPPLDERVARVFDRPIADEIDVVTAIQELLATPNSVLLVDSWLRALDNNASEEIYLLFDGLDTGFGPSDPDRQRRRNALEGLFVFYAEVGDALTRLHCKVLLREDLWRHLQFENKSHFFGRSVSLKWSDQTSFFKVALKQALTSEAFRKLLPAYIVDRPTEEWDEDAVVHAWNSLAAERMKGSKTAFTRNWVWNRLADGNDDHSPRYLLQLMNLAVEFERSHKPAVAETPTIIRPRSFIDVLPQVSEQALGAMRDEEFPELRPLLDRLTAVGRTPLGVADLSMIENDVLSLAREVGLIGVYEGDEEHVERYKVPELFRHALKMTRKGQI